MGEAAVAIPVAAACTPTPPGAPEGGRREAPAPPAGGDPSVGRAGSGENAAEPEGDAPPAADEAARRAASAACFLRLNSSSWFWGAWCLWRFSWEACVRRRKRRRREREGEEVEVEKKRTVLNRKKKKRPSTIDDIVLPIGICESSMDISTHRGDERHSYPSAGASFQCKKRWRDDERRREKGKKRERAFDSSIRFLPHQSSRLSSLAFSSHLAPACLGSGRAAVHFD